MKNQPSKKAEPREFWIEIWKEHPMNDLIIQRPVGNRQFPKSYAADELVHTIEYSAYQALQEKVQHLEERLEFETEFHSRANAKVESLSGALCGQKRVNAEDEIILSEQIVELEEKLRDTISIALDGLQNSCTCNQLGVMSVCGACHAAEQIRKIEGHE